jgi:hypothetical protein
MLNDVTLEPLSISTAMKCHMPAAAWVNDAPFSEQPDPNEMKNNRLSEPLMLQMRTTEFTIR